MEYSEPYSYRPFQTYGFTEAVPMVEGAHCRLVGTAYHNLASPLIRYDTGDEVSVVARRDGLLQEFRIEAGRTGDFVVDRNGKRITLTGLLFGRHHHAFDIATFVQIAQRTAGSATLYVTVPPSLLAAAKLASLFDLQGVEMDFSFERLDRPLLTRSGKVLLNVTPLLEAIGTGTTASAVPGAPAD